jgi:hypothetical protein
LHCLLCFLLFVLLLQSSEFRSGLLFLSVCNRIEVE